MQPQKLKQLLLNVPRTCFLSHSYRDEKARKRLLCEILPERVLPIIFPPITVSPEQMVSNELVQGILRCDGLIYLQGGNSATSFWVAFERDYALRASKKVFAFDPTTDEFRQDTSAPLHLSIFPSYSRKDRLDAQQVVSFMKNERHFDVWVDSERIMSGTNVADALRTGIARQIEAGGYVVVFWSADSATSLWVRTEWEYAFQKYPGRILPVLLDRTPLPPLLNTVQALQLYGDQQRSKLQRLDDLIVQLYWLIYRNTQQSSLE